MGNCCICNQNKFFTETQFNPDNKSQEKNDENQNNNIASDIVLKNIITSSITEEKLNLTETSRNNIIFNNQKKSIFSFNNKSDDQPDVMDEYIQSNNEMRFENSLYDSKIDDSQFSVSLINMEKDLFNLINDLRTNPKSFITKIEEYRSKLQKNDNNYYIIIDEIKFEFPNGEECFNECINFLNEEKSLEKFDNSASMFESKILFKDKNVSDLYFVLIYNIMNLNNSEDNKIKRSCIMSEKYNKLNITISRDEYTFKLYSFYFSFD